MLTLDGIAFLDRGVGGGSTFGIPSIDRTVLAAGTGESNLRSHFLTSSEKMGSDFGTAPERRYI